jgi:hypothetical protein
VVNNDAPEPTEEGTGKPANNGVPELTGEGVPELGEEGTGKPANDVPGPGVAGVGDCVPGALAMPVAVGAAGET